MNRRNKTKANQIISVIMLVIMVFTVFAGCSSKSDSSKEDESTVATEEKTESNSKYPAKDKYLAELDKVFDEYEAETDMPLSIEYKETVGEEHYFYEYDYYHYSSETGNTKIGSIVIGSPCKESDENYNRITSVKCTIKENINGINTYSNYLFKCDIYFSMLPIYTMVRLVDNYSGTLYDFVKLNDNNGVYESNGYYSINGFSDRISVSTSINPTNIMCMSDYGDNGEYALIDAKRTNVE